MTTPDPAPTAHPPPYPPQPGTHPGTQPAYGYAPTPAYGPPVQDLTVPAPLAVTVAGATAVMNLVAAGLAGRATATRTGTPSDLVTGLWGIATLLVSVGLLAGWLTGAFWLHRARTNADLLFPQARHARSPGWAWGAWVCPVVSLWFPFQVVRDVRLAPQPSRYLGSPLVTWWWTTWLVSVLGDRVIGRVDTWALEHPGDHPALQAFSLLWAGLFVAAAVLWGLVVLRITREQQAAVRGSHPQRPVG